MIVLFGEQTKYIYYYFTKYITIYILYKIINTTYALWSILLLLF